MNLEQRVQALEQEVQLLKAQIQSTLLSIQEQMLNGTYPALRAEEPKTVALPNASVTQMPAPSPVKTVSFTEPTLEPDDLPDDPPPLTRRVARAEEPPDPPRKTARVQAEPPQPRKAVRAEQEVPQRQLARIEEEATRKAPSLTNETNWIELENWVSQKVEKLGIKRTRELITLYARQERFTRQERDLLMQFIRVYEQTAPKPDKTNHASSNGANHNHTKPTEITKRPTIVPQTRTVVEEIRSELREKHAKPVTRSHYEQNPALDERQQLVLRLIAGVLSAGDEISSENGWKN